jgi:peptidyl-prolyl cis-trans isomerase D
MFDLFRSRDKAVRYLLSALLGLVALSMITYLIPGSGYGSGGGAENVLASVGGQKITLRDVQTRLQTIAKGRRLPPEMLKQFAPMLIEQLITEHAVQYQAERMGFRVTDQDIADAIRKEIPQLFQNGQFIGTDSYAAVLAQQNMTVPEFEGIIRKQILLNRLRGVALESTVITAVDIEAEFNRRNEKATIEYVKVLSQKMQGEVKVSDDDVKQFYDKNKTSFTAPEKKGLLLIVFDPAAVEAATVVPEDRVRLTYERTKDRYRTGERVHARHILLSTAEKSKEDTDKIQAKAEALLKQIKAGADFADLAKKNSDDTNNKDKGGDLGFFERGRMVPEFESAAFSLKPGEISNLVKTSYGVHIVQMLERQDARLKPFDEVKAELTGELRKEAATAKIQTTLDQVQTELKKNPAQAEQIAQKYGLMVTPVEKAGPGDPIPHLGINQDFNDILSRARKGDVTPIVQAPANKSVLAVVREVFPAHPADMAEVAGQIRSQLANNKATQLLDLRAKELFEKAKAQNGDLKAAAKAMGLDLVTAAPFTRNGAIDGLGAASGVPEAFTKPQGTLFGPSTISEGRVVGKVTGRIASNLAELAAQGDGIRQELKQNRARERNSLFEDGIRRQLEKDGKLKVNQDVMKRLVAGYQS